LGEQKKIKYRLPAAVQLRCTLYGYIM